MLVSPRGICVALNHIRIRMAVTFLRGGKSPTVKSTLQVGPSLPTSSIDRKIMKLTSVLLVTNMALTLAACSGDNNEPTLSAEELSTANSGKSTVAATVTPDQSLSPSTSAAVDDTPTPTPTPTSIPASTPRQAPTSAPVIATEPPESFARCQTCHTTNEGGANNLGPNLFGVYGKPARSEEHTSELQ